MSVFIANFGRENYEWPHCLQRGTIATMNDVSVHGLWEQGDREAYIQEQMKGKTWAGITPPKQVASRWFNLMTIVSQSTGDIWIHRDGDDLWWTISGETSPSFERKIEPVTGERGTANSGQREIIVCHKPCQPWRKASSAGSPLKWKSLHAKAREFLATESTLQKLSDENARYARALIYGDDLKPWHSRPDWIQKIEATKGKHGPVTFFDARNLEIARMAQTALTTTQVSNGQEIVRTVKDKNFGFNSKYELENYIRGLLNIQESLCALTEMPLQFGNDCEDPEMRCSLDRIDSQGHYEPGNLQIVCKFANQWKSDRDNEEFKRLIGAVRSIGVL